MNPTKARMMRPQKPPIVPPTTAPTGNDREFGAELGFTLLVCAGANVTVGLGTVNPGFGLGMSPENL